MRCTRLMSCLIIRPDGAVGRGPRRVSLPGRGVPDLPTVIQAVVDRRHRPAGKLILCGSTVSQMARLLGADGPLYQHSGWRAA